MASSPDLDNRIPTASPAWRRATICLLLVFVVLNAVVVGIRSHWLVTDGRLHVTSGIEGPPIYAVWKVMHGHPLYERPNTDNFAFTPYNFAFYYSYADLLRAFNVPDENVITAARLVTVGFAVLGAVATWFVAVRLAGPAARSVGLRLLALALCLTAWSAPGMIGWFVFTVRSDVGAMALAMCGLAAYLRARASESIAWAVAAAVFFFGAWAFKQPVVLTLTGVCLFELLQGRRWKLLFGVAIPCAAGMAIALAVGGPIYLINIVTAPAQNALVVADSAKRFLEIVVPAILFYGFAVADTIPWLFRRTDDPNAAAHRAVGYAFVLSSLVGLVYMGHVGASRNHYYESLVLATAAGTGGLLRALAAGRRGQLQFAALATVIGCVLPAAFLIRPHMNAGFLHWNLTFSDHDSYVARAHLADVIRELPKPVFVSDDDILEQPWIATGGQYPAYLVDPVYYDEAVVRGQIQAGGLEGLVRSRRFAEVIVKKDDPMRLVAEAAGYRRAELPSDVAAAPTMIGRPAVWELYISPDR
jgi:hypothetical protein